MVIDQYYVEYLPEIDDPNYRCVRCGLPMIWLHKYKESNDNCCVCQGKKHPNWHHHDPKEEI